MTRTAYHLHAKPSLGRKASSPWQIGAKGWRDISSRVAAEILADRVMLVAGGVTFYVLLSLFPAASAAVSIYGLVADPVTVASQFNLVRSLLPEVGLEPVEQELTIIVNHESGALGLTTFVSLLVALWTANAAMKSLFEAMNIAYEETESRSFVSLTLASLSLTVACILAFGIASAAVIGLPTALNVLNLDASSELLVQVGGVFSLLLIGTSVLTALYRWGPSRNSAKLRWIAPGVIFAVVGVALASSVFSWYVANVGSYSQTYGSLGALVGFLTWIWLIAMVVIIGAEINAETEHQTLRDSTTGAGKTLGDRGAYVADHIGPGYKDQQPVQAGNNQLSNGRLSLPAKVWIVLPLVAAWSSRKSD